MWGAPGPAHSKTGHPHAIFGVRLCKPDRQAPNQGKRSRAKFREKLMPDLSGSQLLRRMRSSCLTRSTRALSRPNRPQTRTVIVEAGADWLADQAIWADGNSLASACGARTPSRSFPGGHNPLNFLRGRAGAAVTFPAGLIKRGARKPDSARSAGAIYRQGHYSVGHPGRPISGPRNQVPRSTLMQARRSRLAWPRSRSAPRQPGATKDPMANRNGESQ